MLKGERDMRDFENTVQKKAVSAEDIKRAIAKGPDYCSDRIHEFLHHASTLMQSMQSLYMEDAGVMALMGVNVHCEVTLAHGNGMTEKLAVFGFGTENGAEHEPEEGSDV